MSMITHLRVESFVAFQQPLEWSGHASLNVIIGVNDTGKTHLLKLLYAMTRAMEDYARKKAGPEPRELSELLASKLRWTFLPQKMELGRLVTRAGGQRLGVELRWNQDGRLKFGFGRDTSVRINELQVEELGQLAGHKATFLPPKEILSIFDAIVATRESAEIAAFDDTCYDLVQDFRQPTVAGSWKPRIKQVFRHLEEVTGGGEVELQADGAIVFRRGKELFNMHQTAEGIKKIGILSRLMRNRRLTPAGGCMLFVDEPEVNLHPKAIVLFADMLHEFAQSGVQVYLTTHSFFLLKRLEQLARQHRTDYTLLDLRKSPAGGVTGQVCALQDGLPLNPIVEESLKLYDGDVALDLGEV